MTTTADHEMECVVSEILSSRTRTGPAACIDALNSLINTEGGKEFLSTQRGERALVLIQLFDYVIILFSGVFTTRIENADIRP